MNRAHPRERSQRGRVLLIDDDDSALGTIRELLVAAGYEVLTLSSPIGATQLIARENVSAVVVDMTSPVMQGPRFTALLSSWERVRDLPVLLISDQSEQAREAVAQVKRVSVLLKEQLEVGLVRTLDRALAVRGGAAPNQSGVVAVRPTVRHYARAALEAWKSFLHGRGGSLPAVLSQLVSLRAETLAIGLEQTPELVAVAIELVERTDAPRSVESVVEHTVAELLEWLITLEPDKGRAFDRSLALTLHRARLEHARDGE
ncbi:MAG: response regulator [Polyangiales bacterium]